MASFFVAGLLCFLLAALAPRAALGQIKPRLGPLAQEKAELDAEEKKFMGIIMPLDYAKPPPPPPPPKDEERLGRPPLVGLAHGLDKMGDPAPPEVDPMFINAPEDSPMDTEARENPDAGSFVEKTEEEEAGPHYHHQRHRRRRRLRERQRSRRVTTRRHLV